MDYIVVECCVFWLDFATRYPEYIRHAHPGGAMGMILHNLQDMYIRSINHRVATEGNLMPLNNIVHVKPDNNLGNVIIVFI